MSPGSGERGIKVATETIILIVAQVVWAIFLILVERHMDRVENLVTTPYAKLVREEADEVIKIKDRRAKEEKEEVSRINEKEKQRMIEMMERQKNAIAQAGNHMAKVSEILTKQNNKIRGFRSLAINVLKSYPAEEREDILVISELDSEEQQIVAGELAKYPPPRTLAEIIQSRERRK